MVGSSEYIGGSLVEGAGTLLGVAGIAFISVMALRSMYKGVFKD